MQQDVQETAEEETARLHAVYSLVELQDYINRTTVPGPNGRPQRFMGVAWPKLRRQLPELNRFVLERQQHVLNRHPEDRLLYIEARNFHLNNGNNNAESDDAQDEQQQQETAVLVVPQCQRQRQSPGKAAAASPTKPKVASRHIYQTAHDWQSTLGNFYRFVMDMEVLELADLSIVQLWSVQRVHAWILWTDARVSGSTKRNKALHLIKVLQWLADDCLTASGKAAQEGIKRSLKKLHRFSENGKQQYLRAVGKAMDEEKLINSGAALHESEQPAFIMWLLQRISKCAEFFLPTAAAAAAESTSSTTDNNDGQAAGPAPAALVVSSHSSSGIENMRYIQMLIEVFNGGYRREIVAGLRVDRLSWTATEEEDQELLATVATEKTARFKTDKVPMSRHVKHFIEFHLQRVRPILLACDNSDGDGDDDDNANNDDDHNGNGDDDDGEEPMDEEDELQPLSLWISSRGAPLEFNSYTAGLKVVSHAFHPGLNLTSLSFRRAYITAFYKGRIAFDGAAADFRRNMSILLNVAETVMETHYDRHSAGPTNRVTQNVLSSVHLKEAAVRDQLAQTNARLMQGIDPTKRVSVESVTQRLRRCTADDEAWTKQMAAAGLTTKMTPLGGQFSVRLQRLAEHNHGTQMGCRLACHRYAHPASNANTQPDLPHQQDDDDEVNNACFITKAGAGGGSSGDSQTSRSRSSSSSACA